jgi:hypothetical protein
VDYALSVISESLDHICAERLTPNLVWMAEHLEAHGELQTTPRLLKQLENISVSTVSRRLKGINRDKPRLPQRGPERANQVTRDVPMRKIPWDIEEPGHFEVDTVHHCGPVASGEYVHTVQMIDVATGWSERAASLGRSFLVMRDAFERIQLRLPFKTQELHPDNGSEFFNNHLVRYFHTSILNLELTRSRPFRKNDNRFVEQKNSTLVRAYLGNDRLDTVTQTKALNILYDKMWLYYNFFQPVIRLVEKRVVSEDGKTRVIRRYDQPRTPFDRLCEIDALEPEVRKELEALRDRTNPRQLRREIYDLIEYIFSLPGAVPGEVEDVRLTLNQPLQIEKGEDGSPVTLSFERAIASR